MLRFIIFFLKVLIKQVDVYYLKLLIRSLYSKPNVSLDKISLEINNLMQYRQGFYVELGGFDGIKQSNTLNLRLEKDWKGILIEANPVNFIKCVKNRGDVDLVFCCACGNNNKDEFIEMVGAGLMSFSSNSGLPDVNDHLIKAQNHKQIIAKYSFGSKVRTLTAILDEAKAPFEIDFLSLDVEGYELQVLEGINFDRYNFKYILVECWEFEKIDKFLNAFNYKLVKKVSPNDAIFKKMK